MSCHRSTVYVPAIEKRGSKWKLEPISKQFRFLVRLANACRLNGVEYDVEWKIVTGRAIATITAIGRIPEAKALPKEPRLKLLPTWKPSMLEAEYSLEAWAEKKANVISAKRPGFVVRHSSGLSLVRKGESDSGELMSDTGDDLRKGWMLTHDSSGLGFGLSLNFQKATQALLLAAEQPIDWTLPQDELTKAAGFSRAGLTVQAKFGDSHKRIEATDRLERMAA